jgi:hypothetical protein
VNRHPAITLFTVVAIVAAVFIIHSFLRTIANGVSAALGLPGALWQGLKDDFSAATSAVSDFVTGDAPSLVKPLPFTFAPDAPAAMQPQIDSVFSGAPTFGGLQLGGFWNP